MQDSIIISDVHIGANNCQGKLLVEFLEKIHKQEILTKRLILNGDVFDKFDSRLCKWNWKILSSLRSISDIVELVWIKGNHDSHGPVNSIANLIGAEYYEEEYIFESGDKRVLCLHGDIFDNFISDHPILTWFADNIYWLLQRLDESCYLAKLAKHSSKTFLRCAEEVEKEAIKLAKRRNCNVVCCGHVHYPAVKDGEITYMNSGSWTELPCTFLSIKDGVCKLENYEAKNGQERISQA